MVNQISGSYLGRGLVVVAALSLFVYFAVGSYSLTAMVAVLAMFFVATQASRIDVELLARSLVTPYLPFIVVLSVVIAFQLGDRGDLALGGVVGSYVIARMLRAVLSVTVLSVAIAATALLVGLGRLIGSSELSGFIPFASDIAAATGKNPTGWTIAFGLIAAVILLLNSRLGGIRFTVGLPLVVGLAVLLALSDSVTSVLAAGTASVAMALVAMVVAVRRGPLRDYTRKVSVLSAVGAGIIALVVTLPNIFSQAGDASSQLLRRDFGSLTGRDAIWECYFQNGILGSSEQPWRDTQTCSGFSPYHLHNVFLESHLIGGFVLAFLLFLGLTIVMLVQGRRAVDARSIKSFVSAVFALGLTVVGFTVGLTESFLYWDLVFGAVALFAAPPVMRGQLRLLQPRKYAR